MEFVELTNYEWVELGKPEKNSFILYKSQWRKVDDIKFDHKIKLILV